MIQQSEPFLLYFSLYKKCACNAQITLFQSFFNLQSFELVVIDTFSEGVTRLNLRFHYSALFLIEVPDPSTFEIKENSFRDNREHD